MQEMVFATLIGLAGLAVLWLLTRSRGGVRSVVGLSKPRTLTLLIGLSNSGKTTLLSRLVFGKDSTSTVETASSMGPNRVTLPTGHVVVDYPGHRRLRRDVYPLLEEAKQVVVVVDAETIQDDAALGAMALAELICDIFQSSAFHGVKQVLFACTKRDKATSFRATAVKKILETEMSRLLSTRSGSVGSINSIQNVATKVSKESAAARQNDHCALFVNEDGKFSFSTLAVPVTFEDVSSFDADGCASTEPVEKFIDDA